MNDLYTRSGEFLENKVTDNIIEFCHRWFGLGNFQEILSDIDEFYQKNRISYSTKNYWKEFNVEDSKIIVTPATDLHNKKINPIYFGNDHIHPISFFNERKHNS